MEKCLEFIIRSNQHYFVRLAEALVACGHFSIRAGLDHLLSGLLGVLLVSWGEVVDGILHHVAWVHGLLKTTGNAMHLWNYFCRNGTGT